MTGRLAGKVALITGGSSGLGQATAQAFATEGATVVIADTNVERGRITLDTIQQAGGEAIFIHADVTQVTEVQAMVTQTVETFGQLDYAFNNAGVAPREGYTIAEYPEEEWDRVININLKGVFLCLKYELQQMQQQGYGAIVNTASIFGLVAAGGAEGGGSSYIAGKHGVVGLTKAAALENAQQNIRVNAVCPGYIETPLIADMLGNAERRAQLVALHPLGRLGQPQEVAEAVVWLCSGASFVTGQALGLDGGYMAQ